MKKVALLAVLALFLILALPGGPAMAASVTADGTASSTIIAANATSATFSHTTGTGSNRLLMVGVSWNCGTTDRSISSVTFTPSGGSAQALTVKITQLGYNSSNPRYSAIYYLVGPPSGTTGDITITFSGTVSNGGVAGAADFAGVDPATPLGTAVGSTSSSTGTAISQALSGLNGNEMVFDNVFAGSSGTSTTLTAGASQTQEWSVNGYTGSTNPVNCIAGASYQQATSSSLTMSWTLATTAARWCIAAVPINPYSGGITRTLTMAAAPSGGGGTSPAVGDHSYADGAVVPISATPNVGYIFSNWSNGVTGSTNPTTVTMNANKTVQANFTATNYNLTVNVTPGGGGTTTPTGTTSHGAGEVVNLTATPNSGYLFSGWTGATVADPTKASTTITMDGVKTVTANFTAIPAGTAYQDGTPATGSIATGTTLTFSHTTGTGGNRLMLVGVSWNCGSSTTSTISSVTFTPSGGSAQPLTEVLTQLTDSASAPRYSAVYKLVGPSSGVTGDVTVTFGASVTNGAIAGAVNFAGVDQITPLGTPVGAASANNSTTAASVNVTGLSGNELIFDNVFFGSSAAATTLTADASQTSLWSINGYTSSTTSFNCMGGASTKQATGTSVTMSWTSSASAWWATVAVPIKPYAGGTSRTLTMASNPSGGGSTSPATGDHSYADGAVVDISATPNIGYVFSSWSGGVTGSTNPTTVTMNGNKTVTANFTAQNYDLNMAVSPSGAGTTTPSVGAHSYGVNTVVDITATPASGYLFDHWTGDVANSTKASTTTTVTAAKTVTAVFTAIPAGTAYQDGTPATGSIATGTTLTFSHTTGTGGNRLMLVGVSWNCGSSTTSTISSVTFTPSGGSAQPLTEVLTQLTDSASAPRYSAIYKLVGPGSGVTGDVTVTFGASVTNGAIAGAVNFAGVDQVTPLGTPVGAASTNNTTTAVTVDVTGLSGNELIFDNVFNGVSAAGTTLTPDASQTQLWSINGYTASSTSFNTMAGASTKQATGTSVTMSWTASSAGWWATVAVPIKPYAGGTTRTLTMASNPGGGGTTSPATGDHSYSDGAVVDISATPNIGYVFSSWSGGVTGSTNPTTVTMNANKTVTANFTAQNYDLTMAVSPGGAGTTTPSVGAYSYGVNTVVNIEAIPASGYLFDHWTGVVADSTKASTTTTITAAKTVTAVFTEIPTGVVTQEGAIDTGGIASGTTLTFSHTTGTGTDRLMLVGISWNCGTSTTSTISSVTFTPSGGSALPLTNVITQLGYSASNPRYSAIYKLVAPPSGVTGDVTITFASSVSNGVIGGAVNFANVDQITPLGTAVGAGSSTNDTTATVDVTGLAGNELVFDNVFMGSSAASTTLAPDASQTQRWSINGYTASTTSFNNIAGASTKQAAGSSVTMSWTVSTAGRWAIAAVPIRPAGGSSTVPVSVIQGWNLVAGATGTTFPGDLFAWTGSNYQSVTNTASWQGYWYKATSAGTVDINVAAGPQTIDLNTGWNLIGNCMSTPAALTLPNGVSAWIYVNGSFQSTTSLLPGQGAWVKPSGAGQSVTLTPTPV